MGYSSSSLLGKTIWSYKFSTVRQLRHVRLKNMNVMFWLQVLIYWGVFSRLKEKTNKTVEMMEQPWAKRCCWVYYIHLNSFARPISIRQYRVCYTNPGANYLCNGEFVFRSALALLLTPILYISFPFLPFISIFYSYSHVMPATQADTVFGIVTHYTRGRKLIGRHFF
jgi:hypothetical protein